MLTSPQVELYIEQNDNNLFKTSKLNEDSTNLLKELFSIVKKINNCGEHEMERRKFYFFAPKGTFEQYKKIYDEPEETLKEWFRTETDRWYEIKFLFHQSKWAPEPYYGVYINNFYVLSINDSNEKESPLVDATDFIKELIEIAKETIKEIEEGIYNEKVKKELPYDMRYGKVPRKYFWEALPSEKEKYKFTEHEIEVLRNYKLEEEPVILTARKYYEICGICYKSIGLEQHGTKFEDTEEERKRYHGITPKELYYRYADGRDDGLSAVPMDDEEEFQKWLKHKEPYEYSGGHPFEIMFSWSGNKSVHLYAHDNKLILAGGEYPANVMAARMYVALKDKGIPVGFNAKEMLDKIDEKDDIGILPGYVWREDCFDGVYDYINISESEYKKLKDYIIWEEIPEVHINA